MERMDVMARDQYLKVLIRGYLKGERKTRGQILDEYCKNTGQNRKYSVNHEINTRLSPDFPPNL